MRELSENLRKRHMDHDVTPEDQRLIYGIFDKKNEGSIPVGELLKRIEMMDDSLGDSIANRGAYLTIHTRDEMMYHFVVTMKQTCLPSVPFFKSN